MGMRSVRIGSMCALAALAPSLAASVSAAPNKYPYRVATTVGMITDIVREVAGDKAEVTGIIREGVDPHLYSPTRGDISIMMKADVIFYNGLLLEGKMGDTLVRVARRKPVFAVTERLDKSYLLSPQEFEGHYDPHVWMDVRGWRQAVKAVAEALSEFDPPNADAYQRNARSYDRKLQALDAYVKRVIGTIPSQQRVLITAHDAFNYFGRAYGLDVRGIQGISTESEAGLRDITALVDFIVKRDIQAIFVETSVADKNVRALVEGAAARGHDVRIGGTLFSDAMGAPGTYEGTYIGMIDHNATTIARALGGEAPVGGMQDSLEAARAHKNSVNTADSAGTQQPAPNE